MVLMGRCSVGQQASNTTLSGLHACLGVAAGVATPPCVAGDVAKYEQTAASLAHASRSSAQSRGQQAHMDPTWTEHGQNRHSPASRLSPRSCEDSRRSRRSSIAKGQRAAGSYGRATKQLCSPVACHRQECLAAPVQSLLHQKHAISI